MPFFILHQCVDPKDPPGPSGVSAVEPISHEQPQPLALRPRRRRGPYLFQSTHSTGWETVSECDRVSRLYPARGLCVHAQGVGRIVGAYELGSIPYGQHLLTLLFYFHAQNPSPP